MCKNYDKKDYDLDAVRHILELLLEVDNSENIVQACEIALTDINGESVDTDSPIL